MRSQFDSGIPLSIGPKKPIGYTLRMKTVKLKVISALLILPFFLTFIERYILKPLIAVFPLPDTSIYLFKVSAISLILLAPTAFLGRKYGLEISSKLRKVLAGMFLALLGVSYLFLFSLKAKGFFDDLAVIHLTNWIVTVFREEFLLRGVIQTEASYVLKGKFLKISYSIWLSTVAFSLWHIVNLAYWPWQVVAIQMIACIPSGIILGLIREKTGNTLLTYLLHITGDLLFFALYTLILGKLFFSLY